MNTSFQKHVLFVTLFYLPSCLALLSGWWIGNAHDKDFVFAALFLAVLGTVALVFYLFAQDE